MFKTLFSKENLQMFTSNKSPLLMKLSASLMEDHLEYGSIMAFHMFCVTIPRNISYLLAEKTAYYSNAVLHFSMPLNFYSDSSSSRSSLSYCYLVKLYLLLQAHPKFGYCPLYCICYSLKPLPISALSLLQNL